MLTENSPEQAPAIANRKSLRSLLIAVSFQSSMLLRLDAWDRDKFLEGEQWQSESMARVEIQLKRRRRSLTSAQGSSEARTLGKHKRKPLNPEKGSPIVEPFQGCSRIVNAYPGLSLRSNPGLGLANAFGVFKA
jgi:hypothetical protein